MVRLPLVLFLMVVIALSGCTDATVEKKVGDDEQDPSSGNDDGGTVSDPSVGMHLVPWNVGDWWQYKVDYRTGESYTSKILVHAEDDASYKITAEDHELILRSSFNHYPNFGDVRKTDLAQKIHGADVPYFQFPMKNGTWTGDYRDQPATFNRTYTMLDTGKGQVPGFATTMAVDADGLVRVAHGWSPVTKWFTRLTFDFDGVDPVDVTATLLDWGTNHTGDFPVVEIVDGVHRAFPTNTVPPPEGGLPTPPPSRETFTVGAAGSSVLWAVFAGAGGPGAFEASVTPPAGGTPQPIEWRPTAAATHFAWGELVDAAAGEWTVAGHGAAQGFAFMFLETYEARTVRASLP